MLLTLEALWILQALQSPRDTPPCTYSLKLNRPSRSDMKSIKLIYVAILLAVAGMTVGAPTPPESEAIDFLRAQFRMNNFHTLLPRFNEDVDRA